MGGEEYVKLGTPRNSGTRILCVSGDVKKPGYYEVEVGKVTFGELLYDVCGGPKDGRKFKAVIPGGSSSKILRCDETFKIRTRRRRQGLDFWELPLDFDTLAACGSMAGSGGVIVMDDSRACPGSSTTSTTSTPTNPAASAPRAVKGRLWMKKDLRPHRRRPGHSRGCQDTRRSRLPNRRQHRLRLR